ncbi:hypothetical protein JWK42_02450 [Staphylococcus epidermidis]|uniref:hypothetical protein n=1 Tax=Staphylococcus epidermidis TaxID=1282 RepID=UPI0002432DD9|nr:hypothetical protein [Staphylococcus epidermidis]EHM69771.1 hypothetical protein SEVCU071_0482 [Staphylococcus epidermidis VCU071]KAB2192012.1 hypothetical protein F9B42_07520 [Staphylococcus epidermidis]MBC3169148.1 hypothetical protein [Staphylococcus epidermidis]MBE0334014.1 hypothetical protein [Staphylococcus epidermidis]MBM0766706.1 hypothetical protein [Staphylococcus epidermidis]
MILLVDKLITTEVITIDSKINKQIAKNLSLEGMIETKEQQKQILVLNNKKEITNELIRKIAFRNDY